MTNEKAGDIAGLFVIRGNESEGRLLRRRSLADLSIVLVDPGPIRGRHIADAADTHAFLVAVDCARELELEVLERVDLRLELPRGAFVAERPEVAHATQPLDGLIELRHVAPLTRQLAAECLGVGEPLRQLALELRIEVAAIAARAAHSALLFAGAAFAASALLSLLSLPPLLALTLTLTLLSLALAPTLALLSLTLLSLTLLSLSLLSLTLSLSLPLPLLTLSLASLSGLTPTLLVLILTALTLSILTLRALTLSPLLLALPIAASQSAPVLAIDLLLHALGKRLDAIHHVADLVQRLRARLLVLRGTGRLLRLLELPVQVVDAARDLRLRDVAQVVRRRVAARHLLGRPDLALQTRRADRIRGVAQRVRSRRLLRLAPRQTRR